MRSTLFSLERTISILQLIRNVTTNILIQEQKLSDVGHCLCNILPTIEPHQLVGAFDSIPNLLHGLMCLLANFRNQESRYLEPLAERATAVLMEKAGPMAAPLSLQLDDDVEDITDGSGFDHEYT